MKTLNPNQAAFNLQLKQQADKRKAKMQAHFERVQPMSVSDFWRKYYPELSRSRVSVLLGRG